MGDKLRVLVIDEEIPLPANTGKRLRTSNLLTQLADDFEIDLLVHDSDSLHGHGTDGGPVAEMEQRGVRVIVADSRLPHKKGLAFAWRILSNLLFSKLPYSVASHQQPGYKAKLDSLIAEGSYDLVHCEWSPYGIYLDGIELPTVIAAHNVEAQIWERLAETETGFARKMVVSVQASRMKTFERDLFRRSTYATAVSAEDAKMIDEMGCPHVDVVANGVDTSFFTPSDAPTKDRTLVFTGSMDWMPNQDAIRWFRDDVHPILEKTGDYKLFVVGRNPPEWMQQLPEQFVVTGTVDDVRPYIRDGAVYVVPLRAGGGSRLKILEAFAMSKAVVSTTVGAEGLEHTDGTDIVLADTAQSFCDAIQALWVDPVRARALGEAGRKLVLSRYDWSSISKLQAQIWRQACGRNADPTPSPAGVGELANG